MKFKINNKRFKFSLQWELSEFGKGLGMVLLDILFLLLAIGVFIVDLRLGAHWYGYLFDILFMAVWICFVAITVRAYLANRRERNEQERRLSETE